MTTDNTGDSALAEFAEFENSGEVEVAEGTTTPVEEIEKITKPEIEDNAPESEEGDEGDEGDEEPKSEEKKKPDAKESQINRLKREKSELATRLRDLENGGMAARLDALEKSLQGGKSADINGTGTSLAPDPSDIKKYPLGRLDDRYIEDRIEYGIELAATKQADTALQREQENEQNQSIQREHIALLGKVDELSTRGSELFDDFQDSVVESGMRGDWDLSQTTFEAAYEADNGAQILYELSQDMKEATRVAKLSPLAQLKFVSERDAEIGKGKTPRTKPSAGAPPQNTARGVNSRMQINPATDNLDDFEKAWEADAKKSR